jgi:hypothetical protein
MEAKTKQGHAPSRSLPSVSKETPQLEDEYFDEQEKRILEVEYDAIRDKILDLQAAVGDGRQTGPQLRADALEKKQHIYKRPNMNPKVVRDDKSTAPSLAQTERNKPTKPDYTAQLESRVSVVSPLPNDAPEQISGTGNAHGMKSKFGNLKEPDFAAENIKLRAENEKLESMLKEKNKALAKAVKQAKLAFRQGRNKTATDPKNGNQEAEAALLQAKIELQEAHQEIAQQARKISALRENPDQARSLLHKTFRENLKMGSELDELHMRLLDETATRGKQAVDSGNARGKPVDSRASVSALSSISKDSRVYGGAQRIDTGFSASAVPSRSGRMTWFEHGVMSGQSSRWSYELLARSPLTGLGTPRSSVWGNSKATPLRIAYQDLVKDQRFLGRADFRPAPRKVSNLPPHQNPGPQKAGFGMPASHRSSPPRMSPPKSSAPSISPEKSQPEDESEFLARQTNSAISVADFAKVIRRLQMTKVVIDGTLPTSILSFAATLRHTTDVASSKVEEIHPEALSWLGRITGNAPIAPTKTPRSSYKDKSTQASFASRPELVATSQREAPVLAVGKDHKEYGNSVNFPSGSASVSRKDMKDHPTASITEREMAISAESSVIRNFDEQKNSSGSKPDHDFAYGTTISPGSKLKSQVAMTIRNFEEKQPSSKRPFAEAFLSTSRSRELFKLRSSVPIYTSSSSRRELGHPHLEQIKQKFNVDAHESLKREIIGKGLLGTHSSSRGENLILQSPSTTAEPAREWYQMREQSFRPGNGPVSSGYIHWLRARRTKPTWRTEGESHHVSMKDTAQSQRFSHPSSVIEPRFKVQRHRNEFSHSEPENLSRWSHPPVLNSSGSVAKDHHTQKFREKYFWRQPRNKLLKENWAWGPAWVVTPIVAPIHQNAARRSTTAGSAGIKTGRTPNEAVAEMEVVESPVSPRTSGPYLPKENHSQQRTKSPVAGTREKEESPPPGPDVEKWVTPRADEVTELEVHDSPVQGSSVLKQAALSGQHTARGKSLSVHPLVSQDGVALYTEELAESPVSIAPGIASVQEDFEKEFLDLEESTDNTTGSEAGTLSSRNIFSEPAQNPMSPIFEIDNRQAPAGNHYLGAKPKSTKLEIEDASKDRGLFSPVVGGIPIPAPLQVRKLASQESLRSSAEMEGTNKQAGASTITRSVVMKTDAGMAPDIDTTTRLQNTDGACTIKSLSMCRNAGTFTDSEMKSDAATMTNTRTSTNAATTRDMAEMTESSTLTDASTADKGTTTDTAQINSKGRQPVEEEKAKDGKSSLIVIIRSSRRVPAQSSASVKALTLFAFLMSIYILVNVSGEIGQLQAANFSPSKHSQIMSTRNGHWEFRLFTLMDYWVSRIGGETNDLLV